jgi:hypothetical protein
MRYFILLDLQHLVLAFFLGLLAMLVAYLAWCGYPARAASESELTEHVANRHGPSRPLPPLLVVIYTGAALWALGYAVVRGFFGGPIS